MTINQQWLLAKRPTGRAIDNSDFELSEIQPRRPDETEVLVKALYFSFDPAQKGWMENLGGYVAPTVIGQPMRGSGIGQVIESGTPDFEPGDIVKGMFHWQTHPTLSAKELIKIEDDEHKTAHLSVLGVTGMTAYFGLLNIGQPKSGDTVVVSGAAGATGSIVGQIANLQGCRTIGIAGGKDKCQWLIDEVGYAAAIDYKKDDVQAQLAKHCPESIDVFYDNVGGEILNHALSEINMGARVVICGGISRYAVGTKPTGPENYFNLIFKRARMEGFIVIDYEAEFPKAKTQLKQWITEGKIVYKEDIQHGFENMPITLMRLFKGQNFGKQLLKVAG
jgi:NADPH-dependent curcumin reductase CurA